MPAPTAEEFAALPEATRRYIMALEQQTVPASAVRDAIVWRETAEALVVRVRELKAVPSVVWHPVAEVPPRADPYLVTREVNGRRFVAVSIYSGEEWWADGLLGEVVAWAVPPEPWKG